MDAGNVANFNAARLPAGTLQQSGLGGGGGSGGQLLPGTPVGGGGGGSSSGGFPAANRLGQQHMSPGLPQPMTWEKPQPRAAADAGAAHVGMGAQLLAQQPTFVTYSDQQTLAAAAARDLMPAHAHGAQPLWPAMFRTMVPSNGHMPQGMPYGSMSMASCPPFRMPMVQQKHAAPAMPAAAAADGARMAGGINGYNAAAGLGPYRLPSSAGRGGGGGPTSGFCDADALPVQQHQPPPQFQQPSSQQFQPLQPPPQQQWPSRGGGSLPAGLHTRDPTSAVQSPYAASPLSLHKQPADGGRPDNQLGSMPSCGSVLVAAHGFGTKPPASVSVKAPASDWQPPPHFPSRPHASEPIAHVMARSSVDAAAEAAAAAAAPAGPAHSGAAPPPPVPATVLHPDSWKKSSADGGQHHLSRSASVNASAAEEAGSVLCTAVSAAAQAGSLKAAVPSSSTTRPLSQALVVDSARPAVPAAADKSKRIRRKRCGICGPCQLSADCGQCQVCCSSSPVNAICKARKCVMLTSKPAVSGMMQQDDRGSDRPVPAADRLTSVPADGAAAVEPAAEMDCGSKPVVSAGEPCSSDPGGAARGGCSDPRLALAAARIKKTTWHQQPVRPALKSVTLAAARKSFVGREGYLWREKQSFYKANGVPCCKYLSKLLGLNVTADELKSKAITYPKSSSASAEGQASTSCPVTNADGAAYFHASAELSTSGAEYASVPSAQGGDSSGTSVVTSCMAAQPGAVQIGSMVATCSQPQAAVAHLNGRESDPPQQLHVCSGTFEHGGTNFKGPHDGSSQLASGSVPSAGTDSPLKPSDILVKAEPMSIEEAASIAASTTATSGCSGVECSRGEHQAAADQRIPEVGDDPTDEELAHHNRLQVPPSCDCPTGKYDENIEGPFYTQLGTASSIDNVRLLMEERTCYRGKAIRIEKVRFTGKEGCTSLGCPAAKWVLKRSGDDEKMLVCVRNRRGHSCPTAWLIVAIVCWEGVPVEAADHIYGYLVRTLPVYGFETERRCGTNNPRNCACQGWDVNRRGASFSFGCSWSVYYDGCKFARSKRARKFRVREESLEEVVESKLQALSQHIGPLFKLMAPAAHAQQVRYERIASDCRLGFRSGRPFSGVTATVDFCAHAHYDYHNMNNGSTVVVTLTKHRGHSKPDDQQLHVLPLYILDETDESGSMTGVQEKLQTGTIEVLDKETRVLRQRSVPLQRKKKGTERFQSPKVRAALLRGQLEAPGAAYRATSGLAVDPDHEPGSPEEEANSATTPADGDVCRTAAALASESCFPADVAAESSATAVGSAAAATGCCRSAIGQVAGEPSGSTGCDDGSSAQTAAGCLRYPSQEGVAAPNCIVSRSPEEHFGGSGGCGERPARSAASCGLDDAMAAEELSGDDATEVPMPPRPRPPSPELDDPQPRFIKEPSERLFEDPLTGGVALALTHGAVLFEVAERELHSTTALRNPDRYNPTRISLVFYQHKKLNFRRHGYHRYVRAEMRRQQARHDARMHGVPYVPKGLKYKRKRQEEALKSAATATAAAAGTAMGPGGSVGAVPMPPPRRPYKRKLGAGAGSGGPAANTTGLGLPLTKLDLPELGGPTRKKKARVVRLPPYKWCWSQPVRLAEARTTDTVATQWVKPECFVTGPYQRWISL